MIVLAFTTQSLLAAPEATPEVPSRSEVSDKAFGDHLLAEGDPFNALTWYRHALFEDPTRPDAGALRFRIALCYERGERWAAAEAAWLDLDDDPVFSSRATYRAGVSLLAAGKPAAARLHLTDLHGDWAEPAAFVLGVAAAEQRDFVAAQRDFEAFISSHPSSPFHAHARASLQVLQEGPRRRAPALAGTMSLLIPGTGQLYAGQAGDALMAFAVPGFLAVWTYTLLRHGIDNDVGWEVVSGGVLAGGTAITWSSNVIGAYRGARRMNGHLARKHAAAVRREAAHPDLELDAGAVAPPQ